MGMDTKVSITLKAGFYCWNCNHHFGEVDFHCSECGQITHNPLFRKSVEIPESIWCDVHLTNATLKSLTTLYVEYECKDHLFRKEYKDF